jgi:PCI domain
VCTAFDTQQNKQNRILEDTFIMEYIDPLKRRMREQVLLAMVQPYQRVTVAFLAKELNLTAIDVVSSLVDTSAYSSLVPSVLIQALLLLLH